ncbi:unnamed protein product [Porites lobata]|uniref:Uncharacterized protein n=1 Tax=Porites lobata TaxID=104759 RepID=A0ABN8Q992_9CNID|nr:unnamed protein product [Porites lobata]
MPGRYHFNEIWLEKDAYKSWPKKDDKNSNKGFCFACKKSINLKVMGESALVSHMKGKKHKEYLKNLQGNEKTTKIRDFFSPSASTSQALEIIPFVVQYVPAAKSGEVKEHKNESSENVQQSVKDPLLTAKLNFFLTIFCQGVNAVNAVKPDVLSNAKSVAN